jgi:hypothetical protein
MPFTVVRGMDGFGVQQICDQTGGEDRNLLPRDAYSDSGSALGVAAGDVLKKCQVLAGPPADLVVEERRNVIAAASLITVETEYRAEAKLDGGLADGWFRP